MPKTAGILLIGNEILSGKIADANAAYLCRELRGLGVEVRRISVIPDEVDLTARGVAAFSRDYDVVFTSGGVGPTHDDVTIEGVARAMAVPVVRHPTLAGLLEGWYGDRLNDAHLKMAETPEGAELVGGEPVRFPTILVRNVYVLPGVPGIFRQKVYPIPQPFLPLPPPPRPPPPGSPNPEEGGGGPARAGAPRAPGGRAGGIPSSAAGRGARE